MKIKLTAKQVHVIYPALDEVIQNNRTMPFKGKYRLGRWHAKLQPEYWNVENRRVGLIKGYDCPQMQTDLEGVETPVPGGYRVPPEKDDEYQEQMKGVFEETLTFDMELVPYELVLSDDAGAITASELARIGDLIAEPVEE